MMEIWLNLLYHFGARLKIVPMDYLLQLSLPTPFEKCQLHLLCQNGFWLIEEYGDHGDRPLLNKGLYLPYAPTF